MALSVTMVALGKRRQARFILIKLKAGCESRKNLCVFAPLRDLFSLAKTLRRKGTTINKPSTALLTVCSLNPSLKSSLKRISQYCKQKTAPLPQGLIRIQNQDKIYLIFFIILISFFDNFLWYSHLLSFDISIYPKSSVTT